MESEQSTYLPKERLIQIYRRIETQGAVRVADLADEFGTSLMTIRRDLAELEAKGLVLRTRGGAILRTGILEDYDVDVRRRSNVDKKIAIAHSALALIKQGDTIALDASTTVVQLASLLARQPGLNITVVTNNFMVAEVLASSTSIELFFSGGRLRREAFSTVGVLAEKVISQFAFAKAFVSGTAVDLDAGLMDNYPEEVHMKQLMLRSSKERILLADSTKLMKRSLTKVWPITEFDYVITDSGVDSHIKELLSSSNVKLIIAELQQSMDNYGDSSSVRMLKALY
jgi:DeoR/GlpR family transcriptional regulator of sugar metabolism